MNQPLRWLHNPWVVVVVVGNLVFFATMALRVTGTLEFAELAAYDLFLRLRPNTGSSDRRIVLVGATEQDIQKWGWPLSDDVLAGLLERLAAHQPRVIGLDIYRDRPVSSGHERLEATLTRNPNIIGVMKFRNENGASGVAPPPSLKDTDRIGFADVLTDPGGVVRRGVLFLDDGYTVAYSFALRLALEYLRAQGLYAQPGEPDPQHLRLGQVTLRPFESNDGGYVKADARGYQFLLDFEGAPAPFVTYSAEDVLSGRLAPDAIRDKIVIVGVTAESVKDYFYTPFSLSLHSDQRTFGIALHGYTTSQLLRAGLGGTRPINVIRDRWEASWIGLWSLLGALLGLWIRSAWRLALSASTGLVVVGVIGYVAMLNRWWIPVVPPALGWLMAAALVTAYISSLERAQRTQLMQLFSRYIPSDVAESLWQQRDQFLDGGRPRPQKVMATVFFSDLKGFTSVSERLEPGALMAWLNDYMETMAELVMQHGGIVDKFIGDAIMAVFGVPLARSSEAEIRQDAIRAVDCALAMRAVLSRLNAQWLEQGLPTISIRIGIFTGPLVAGSLGSSTRMEYTAIGDTVNIASRLEGFDKATSDDEGLAGTCRILIGETTMNYVAGRYHAHRVGVVRLKGKLKPVTVFRITGWATQNQGRLALEENQS